MSGLLPIVFLGLMFSFLLHSQYCWENCNPFTYWKRLLCPFPQHLQQEQGNVKPK